MDRRYWRETVEIVGIVSIVASLLLVAWEIHRANSIAVAGLELELAQGFDEMRGARAIAPDFARLFPKLGAPEGHLITATEASQAKGLARHIIEIYRSAQIAHERGLLEDARLSIYISDLASLVESYPGLVPYLLEIHDADQEIRNMPVFQPIRDVDAVRTPDDDVN
jgi:hypothetical protein